MSEGTERYEVLFGKLRGITWLNPPDQVAGHVLKIGSVEFNGKPSGRKFVIKEVTHGHTNFQKFAGLVVVELAPERVPAPA